MKISVKTISKANGVPREILTRLDPDGAFAPKGIDPLDLFVAAFLQAYSPNFLPDPFGRVFQTLRHLSSEGLSSRDGVLLPSSISFAESSMVGPVGVDATLSFLADDPSDPTISVTYPDGRQASTSLAAWSSRPMDGPLARTLPPDAPYCYDPDAILTGAGPESHIAAFLPVLCGYHLGILPCGSAPLSPPVSLLLAVSCVDDRGFDGTTALAEFLEADLLLRPSILSWDIPWLRTRATRGPHSGDWERRSDPSAFALGRELARIVLSKSDPDILSAIALRPSILSGRIQPLLLASIMPGLEMIGNTDASNHTTLAAECLSTELRDAVNDAFPNGIPRANAKK